VQLTRLDTAARQECAEALDADHAAGAETHHDQ
jgi:hypothetical protein